MPSSPNYVRKYSGPKGEDRYEDKPSQIKNREKRNKARAGAEKEGRVHKGDNKQVDHIKPLIKGGSNTKSNQRVISAKKNQSFARTKKARMK